MARLVRKDWIWSVSVVCLVLGAMLALQFRTQMLSGDISGFRRADKLAQMLAGSRVQVENQEKEIANLRDQLNAFMASITKKDELLGLVNKRLEADQIALGLVDVKGPGVAVSLEDSRLSSEARGTAEAFLVHDYDLWPVVNELRAAGAEAISINGQRVVGSTAIRCAGSVIKVNDVPIASPFEVLAIGNPDTLYSALTIPFGAIDSLKSQQFPVTVAKRQEIIIKAIGVEPKYSYARPIKASAPQAARP